MVNYYRVKIEDVYDIMRGVNFLEKAYPDIYKPIQRRRMLSDYYYKLDKRIVKIDLQFLRILEKNHLPRYLIFKGFDDDDLVCELFSKSEVYLSRELLDKSRITSSSSKSLGECLNEYSPEEIINIYTSFPRVFQNKEKADIISFSENWKKR